jgi:hypothetical protein
MPILGDAISVGDTGMSREFSPRQALFKDISGVRRFVRQTENVLRPLWEGFDSARGAPGVVRGNRHFFRRPPYSWPSRNPHCIRKANVA